VSPDGESIAFYSNRSGEMQVFTIDADGSGLQQLTYSPEHMHSIWSQDGSRMITSDRSLGRAIVINPRIPWNEQTPAELPSLGEENRSFSLNQADGLPDGRLLAGRIFRSDIHRWTNIAVLDLVSNEYRVLTDFDATETTYIGGPCWLRDSRRLVFNFLDKIMLIDSYTKELQEILSLASDRLSCLDITNDDDFIYFTREHREADIWMLTLNEEQK
jgi:Tol biopolymer transport system component